MRKCQAPPLRRTSRARRRGGEPPGLDCDEEIGLGLALEAGGRLRPGHIAANAALALMSGLALFLLMPLDMRSSGYIEATIWL